NPSQLVVPPEITGPPRLRQLEGSPFESRASRAGAQFDVGTADGGSTTGCHDRAAVDILVVSACWIFIGSLSRVSCVAQGAQAASVGHRRRGACGNYIVAVFPATAFVRKYVERE
ncbi:unnamed protein product, partial [Pylaiella littoralis]